MTVGFRCGLEGDSTYLSYISKYTHIMAHIEVLKVQNHLFLSLVFSRRVSCEVADIHKKQIAEIVHRS